MRRPYSWAIAPDVLFTTEPLALAPMWSWDAPFQPDKWARGNIGAAMMLR